MAAVSQTVAMPTYEQAEPLAVEVTHRQQVTLMGGTAKNSVGANGYWVDLSGQSVFQAERVCLGDAAYGGDVSFEAGIAEKPILCDVIVETDHLEIVPDASCPRPGLCSAQPKWWILPDRRCAGGHD